jgi:SET domain-containing protein
MALLEKQLKVKTSVIPEAGKGLFTKKPISKGAKIAEYKGKITTWKEVDDKNGSNRYIFYVKRDYVIDANRRKKALARYANDARGVKKIKGITNNARYVQDGLRVFIEAKEDIPADSEILVDYGREYWDIIKYNEKLSKKQKNHHSTSQH